MWNKRTRSFVKLKNDLGGNRLVRRLIIIASLLLLTGCGTSPEKAMYELMEEAVMTEEVFAKQQQSIVDAEKKEFMLFEEMIALNISEKDKIRALSNEALSVVELRKELIEQEHKSIKAGYEQFQKVALEIEKLKNKEAQALASNIMEAMDQRFATYQQLKVAYEYSLTLDEALYKMFQEDDVTLATLQGKIDEINESYLKVKELKEQFNDQTRTFNQLKRDFYQLANLNIAYNE